MASASYALPRYVLLFALLYGAFGVHSPFFPSFLNARGLEPEAIGVVLALGTAVRLIVAPVAGRISDALDATRAVLAVSLGGASLAAIVFLGAWGFWPLLLISLVSAVALAPVAPLADALALRASERRGPERRRAFDYSWVRGAGSAAFIAGSLLSGQLINGFGLSIVVVLNAGLLALAALSVFVTPPPGRDENVPSPIKTSEGAAHGFRRLLAIPLYRRVILVAALVFGSHAMHDSFAVIRWRDAGIGPEPISLLWSESVAAEVIVFFLIGPRLLERMGPARTAAMCAGAGLIRWIVEAQTTWVPALMLVQPLHGLTFALLHLACMRILSRIVPSGLAATALTVYGTLGAGLSSVLLTLASGPLFKYLGPGGFWVMAALCAIA
ncbi:MAG TPA: MFS transporter, partial [Actinomycetota bacterium]|nr:MFS transporter [Actinomycetota bacterium]